jgi:hypothetical protein
MYRALAFIRGAGGGVLAAVYALAGVVGEQTRSLRAAASIHGD